MGRGKMMMDDHACTVGQRSVLIAGLWKITFFPFICPSGVSEKKVSIMHEAPSDHDCLRGRPCPVLTEVLHVHSSLSESHCELSVSSTLSETHVEFGALEE